MWRADSNTPVSKTGTGRHTTIEIPGVSLPPPLKNSRFRPRLIHILFLLGQGWGERTAQTYTAQKKNTLSGYTVDNATSNPWEKRQIVGDIEGWR